MAQSISEYTSLSPLPPYSDWSPVSPPLSRYETKQEQTRLRPRLALSHYFVIGAADPESSDHPGQCSTEVRWRRARHGTHHETPSSSRSPRCPKAPPPPSRSNDRALHQRRYC